MNQTEKRAKLALKVLSEAILESLQHKRMLGQYAIMGKGKQPVKIPADKLPNKQSP